MRGLMEDARGVLESLREKQNGNKDTGRSLVIGSDSSL